MQDLTHEIIKAVKRIVYSKNKNIEFCHNLHDSVKHKRRFFKVKCCLYLNVLQNIFLCASEKNESHTGLERHKGEWMDFHFWLSLMLHVSFF